MVISGGVNIYPREIEDHLHEHPAILEAAVVGVPDPEWGETLRAFVVLRDGADGDGRGAASRSCREALADYKRPRKVDVRRRAAAQPDRQGPQARAARRAPPSH